eukprot:m.481016 g.481016  ORF g.481016 m.481016 type:complete len:72 (+) comp55086_c0_seq1:362-577(+)
MVCPAALSSHPTDWEQTPPQSTAFFLNSLWGAWVEGEFGQHAPLHLSVQSTCKRAAGINVARRRRVLGFPA